MNRNDFEKLCNECNSALAVFDEFNAFNVENSFKIEKAKQTLNALINLFFTEDESQKLTDWMEKNEFFTSPASTKFHGNVKGGLLLHSLMVCKQSFLFAERIFSVFLTSSLAENYFVSAKDIFIAALAHDFCKAGFYSTEFRKTKNFEGNWVYEPYFKVKNDKRNLGHGNESVLLLISIFPEYIENRTVIEAVSRHMGFSDLSDSESYNYSLFLENPLVVLLQLADEVSSQWFNC